MHTRMHAHTFKHMTYNCGSVDQSKPVEGMQECHFMLKVDVAIIATIISYIMYVHVYMCNIIIYVQWYNQ